ncbi:MAG: hypothetical protein A2V65_07505 [Deltaproteobacteria bacterium RBG_13_49_15]|nr:MAG: hypothetical protein A2V65_07505 [Deltaproteobacteria bacterium RBG_13_49_15]
MTGDASPPAEVYAEYYRACLAGDTGKMLPFFSGKARKEFESFDKDSRNMIAELCKTRPDEVKISKPSIFGDQVSFTVTGTSRQGEKATGKVKMVNEQGLWKVLEDKWEFISQ